MVVEVRNQTSGAVLSIPAEGAVFGRTGGPADIAIEDASVSKRHARINRAEEWWFLADLQSVNGTRVGGSLITAPVALKVGLVFTIGKTSFEILSLGRPVGSFGVVIEGEGKRRAELFSVAEITIGRVEGNEIVLPEGSVSKRHARIVFRDGKFIVIDLKSTSGTRVNGKLIVGPQVLKPSDVIEIGPFRLTLDTDAAFQPTPRPVPPKKVELPSFDDLPKTGEYAVAPPPAPAVAVERPRGGVVVDDDVEAVPPGPRSQD